MNNKKTGKRILILLIIFSIIVSVVYLSNKQKKGDMFFMYENKDYRARFVFSKNSPYAVMMDASSSEDVGGKKYLLNLIDKSIFFIPQSETKQTDEYKKVAFSPSGLKLSYKNSLGNILVLDLTTKKIQEVPTILGQYSNKTATRILQNRYFDVYKYYLESWIDDSHLVFSCSKEKSKSFSYCIYSLFEDKLTLISVMPKIINNNGEYCNPGILYGSRAGCVLDGINDHKIIIDSGYRGFDGGYGVEIFLDGISLYRSREGADAIYRAWNGDWLVAEKWQYNRNGNEKSVLRKINNL